MYRPAGEHLLGARLQHQMLEVVAGEEPQLEEETGEHDAVPEQAGLRVRHRTLRGRRCRQPQTQHHGDDALRVTRFSAI